ncbi:hypothetical protein N7449_000839 [Penicillium cf. viridicatum]|uniref:Protein kinase domain-containing protein n=1 Tax=Penicillium cf. viridicatum TaxID=2972119 RepID=A0A9W9N5M3_9EURO|nr:hypothetical protein N7449_000839 [Penicillium cf. viridicatum]
MARTELVNDMKLDAEVHPDGTSHPTFQPDYARGTTGRWRPKVEIWKRGKILGAGTFGTVWIEKCVPSEGPARVRAVKMIKKSSDPSEQIYCDQELEAMAKFSRPRVGTMLKSIHSVDYSGLFVECLGWFEDRQFIFIAMEHMELGDLQHHLRGPLPENEARQICTQLLRGVQCLHDNQFVHRDLKPGNVLVVNEGPNWHVKIGDFGVSKRYERTALQSKVGTPLYLAPELLRLYPPSMSLQKLRLYTHRVDIWSLGVMVFYLLCHDYPFPSDNSLSLYVRTSNFPAYRKLRSVTQEGQRFIECLLAADATVRLSAKEALQDGWLKQPSFDPVLEISRMSLSETVGSNPIGTGREASRGWDDGDVSSAIVNDQTSWAARRLQSKSTGLQQSKSARQTPISGLSDDLNTAHNKGLSLLSQKQHADAQKMLQKAFELREHALGAHHEDTLASLSLLGDALVGQEKYAEAEAMYRNIWVRQSRALGEKHADTLRSLYMLGKVLIDQDKGAEAEPVCRDAWEGRKRTLGEAHEDTLASLQELGDALKYQDKHAEAESVYRDVWEGRKRTLGEAHEDTLASLQELGDALKYQDKHAEAESVYRDVWEGRKRALGEAHEDTLESLQGLGDALLRQDKTGEAEDVYRDAWEGRKRALGEDCYDTISSLQGLGDALTGQKKHADAEQLYRQAWKARKEAFGAKDEKTLKLLHCLAKALDTHGKHTQAEALFRQACEGRKETLGVDDLRTLESLDRLSINLTWQNKWSEAETLRRQVYKGYREWFGASHPEPLRSLHVLGLILNSQKKYAEAEVVFRKAWKGRSETLGADHEDTLESLGYLRDVSRFSSPFTKTARKPKRSLRESLSSFFT